MNRSTSILAHAIVGACLVGALAIARQPDRQPANAPQLPEAHPLANLDTGDMQAAMERYMKLGETGPQHKFLADHLVGEWDVVSRFWMDPAAPAIESTATSTARPILNGRYIQSDYSGDMMGMPFTGISITGYDNYTKQFNAVWIDSMSTAMFISNGSMARDGSGLTFHGTMNEPMTGEINKTVRFDYDFSDPDRHVFTGWEVAYGEPFKVMELIYTRRK